MMIPIIKYFLLYILLTLVRMSESREHYIDEDRPIKYLYYKFIDVDQEVALNDIIITVSFTKLAGTLFYSMDSNMNQIVVSLVDNAPYLIIAEVNKQKFPVLLSTLCGCEWCRYEKLELRVQINYYINLQCNGRDIVRTTRTDRDLNKNYPIIYDSTNAIPKSKTEAQVWLVNTPFYKDWYPNPEQMSGCVFNVVFGEPIMFTNFTANIDRQCKPACIGNICNGGQCYETYGDHPVCNCTSTFRNGRFCNDSMVAKNLITKNSHFQFKMIKLSWKSSVFEIFKMNNSNIQVYISRQHSKLYFSYEYGPAPMTITKVTLSDQYEPNKEYVCIIHINMNTFDIRLLNNGSWYYALLPIKINVVKEVFDSVTLRSGSGLIDLVYKNYYDHQWSIVDLRYYNQLDNETLPRNVTTNNEGKSTSLATVVTVTIVITVIIIIVSALLIYYCNKKKQRRYKKIQNEKFRIKSIRSGNWVTRNNILTSDDYGEMVNDYNGSKMNSKLIECLRNIDRKSYQTIYSDQERTNCLALLNGIVDKFSSDYQQEIFEMIIDKISLGQVDDWLINCYLLSVGFLAKINDADSSTKLVSVLIQSLDDLCDHLTKSTYLQTLVETFLFAICNILRHDNLVINATIGSRWMSYFNYEDHKMIKFLSAYVIICFNNRGKIVGISEDNKRCVIQYVDEKFKEIKEKNTNEYNGIKEKNTIEYNGFIFGHREEKELQENLSKITNNIVDV